MMSAGLASFGGRIDLMGAFRGYVDSILLQSANKIVVHKTDAGRIVVLKYEVNGTIQATSVKYYNRFCSIVEIENREIAHCFSERSCADNGAPTGGIRFCAFRG
jgi:hypothetical protein